MIEPVRGAAERAARDSYGRLVSYLAYRWRDVAAAEDALSEAFIAALNAWPRVGIPDAPDAWLLTAAKRNLLQMARHQKVVEDPAVTILFEEQFAEQKSLHIPDDRLKMLFICAHPAIDAKVRAPLMLQVVLGLDAARIASAFLISPSNMAQRLVRAKAKIRDSGLRFEEPDASELSTRLDAVLDAIYAAFGTSWDQLDGAETEVGDLAEEAIFLARLVLALLPQEPEAAGVLALMLFSHARYSARLDDDGQFVALAIQDTRRWNRSMIIEADSLLMGAALHRRPGAFQLEAAIQSAHSQRAFTGMTPWCGIATLYELLNAVAPTTGNRVGHAVALAEAGDTVNALALLDAIEIALVRTYQPFWVARAHVLRMMSRRDEAKQCYASAIGLSTQRSIRDFLQATLLKMLQSS